MKTKSNMTVSKLQSEAVKQQKPKELESWQIDKGAQEQEEKQGLDFANKIINKFKPKELDEIFDSYEDGYLEDLKDKVKNALTQQRTELLKTIDTELEVDLKGRINEPDSEYAKGWNDAISKINREL